ncbi:MAG TPA: hypothetical protein VFC46_10590 [Humisphaera sp.]|nr:hypothetical protein [Humisphaera sp.]
MSLSTSNLDGQFPEGVKHGSYTSATANMALTLAIIVFFSPFVWFISTLLWGDKVSYKAEIVGLVASLILPVLVTVGLSILACRQIGSSQTPLKGRMKAWIAIAIGVLSPIIWVIVLSLAGGSVHGR